MASIEPFYFGKEDNLFGIYHSPDQQIKRKAVLVAGPLLDEVLRAHYSLRQMALKLSEKGFHVLRFDYAGLGNSLGEMSSISLDDWVGNIKTSADELCQISGVNSLILLATRFSAGLCAEALQSTKLEKVVLWDPVFAGSAWYGELQSYEKKYAKQLSELRKQSNSRDYLGGYRVSSEFNSRLCEFESSNFEVAEKNIFLTDNDLAVHIPESEETEPTLVPFDCSWPDQEGQVFFPVQVINSICESIN